MRSRLCLILLAGLAALAASGRGTAVAAEAGDECPLPVRPGVSIGGVRLGMSLEEAKATGTFVAPGATETPVWRMVHPAGNLSFRLGKDKRVEEVSLETARPCLSEGSERTVDLNGPEAQKRAPWADCGGQASAMGTGWLCDDHGVAFLWRGEVPRVVVRRSSQMTPFKQAPPPMPKPLSPNPKAKVVTATVPDFVSMPAPDAGTVDAGVPAKAEPPAPVDPCEGNWSPAPQLACGFFGKTESLFIECYPTQLCMGTFAKQAPAHVCVHGANGEPQGAFGLARGGRSLAYKFGKAMPIGTPVRVYFDRDVRVVPAANSYQGPMTPADPAKDPKVVGVAASYVVGARQVANGWVLDLQVPASVGLPAATVEKKLE